LPDPSAAALTRGLTNKMIRARVQARLWEEVSPGVYRLAGATTSWRQRLKAIELWAGPGSAISHRAAAALYGLDGSPPGTAELTMRRTTKTPRVDVIVHYSNRLRDVDIVEHQGIAVTSLPRTLLDLGSVQRPCEFVQLPTTLFVIEGSPRKSY
jgi:predicted transcriptional regulator of viral defense system